jgi:hypothetical protein
MSNNTEESKICQFHKFEKNKYFHGKLMTVRDFETEQSYFDTKRYLLNRLLHGSGIICGFEQIEIKQAEDGTLKISFKDGGVALDCCGREIVVPPNTLDEKILDSGGNSVSDLTDAPNLYLKRKNCYDGYVASASNPSGCEEKCCPGKIVEGFEIIASSQVPEPKGPECRSDAASLKDVALWLEDLEKEYTACPSCEEKERVFLAAVNSDLSVNFTDTAKNRIFFTQKELYQLFKCHILDPDNPHGVTAVQTGALVSVDGVSNPGGNVDLVAGSNITITPDPATHVIEIASAGGGANPGAAVKSVGNSLIAGTSDKYSREDHVHNLEKEIVDFGNLSGKLQKQLELLFMYLRERALKCTVANFKAAGRQFNNDMAFRVAQAAKEAVNKKVYQKEPDFLEFIKELIELLRAFTDSIQGRVTEESFKNFLEALEELKKAFDSGDVIHVAAQQDEVCFYVTELEMRG